MNRSTLIYADFGKLADQMSGSDSVTSKAAKLELEAAAHAAAAPGQTPARAKAAKALVDVAKSNRPRLVRAHALRLIGFVGSKADASAVAGLSKHPELGQDAKIAIKRIQSAK
jgi:hypothetical protein